MSTDVEAREARSILELDEVWNAADFDGSSFDILHELLRELLAIDSHTSSGHTVFALIDRIKHNLTIDAKKRKEIKIDGESIAIPTIPPDVAHRFVAGQPEAYYDVYEFAVSIHLQRKIQELTSALTPDLLTYPGSKMSG